MEIRPILGKVNPADTITRQVRSEDQDYAGKVKQMDNELVDAIRIPVEASDLDVQRKRDQLYNKEGTRDKLRDARQQVLTMNDEDSFNAVLAVSASSVNMDHQFKQNLFNSLKEDDQYQEIIQKLEDANHPNEISVNDQIFRIKQGTLKVHEKNQTSAAQY